ncbi:hypothetical protein ASPWEDRAFT_25232 [Aspergillus wentii DTO 134E9]|uniref:Cytochrome b561 domain-containing protein n=1 Tax=Aspergillus wentii DTO 134E9 TaxID=1073089 RepID=A0A1L9RWU7_ASPWE|nr:uncharacterized protein ASPWEDRAFT_25232 [Aspergillus wentii DTO 134E9]KAI9928922.1 hypothetical protein MW887_001315 [Aspergillus wentii]OJJ39395.1 hypothetical protein ASPWEDRAFT_25232 [Aspergillus wentii DTO 134E9]
MASESGLPQNHQNTQPGEQEPLLGGPGAATQKEGDAVYYNLITGTATVAQAGIWIFAALVWSGVLAQQWILFTLHPVFNSAALLLQVQAALVLQPTASPRQKLLGTRFHYSFQAFSLLAFLVAFVAIEVNKGDHPHFVSVHGRLGLITYLLIFSQALIGVVQYFFPVQVLGSVDTGKKIYKYHRIIGYVLLVLELFTVGWVIQDSSTDWLHISPWGILVSIILVLAGVGARIKKHKLGF